jgi:hypothetical protein
LCPKESADTTFIDKLIIDKKSLFARRPVLDAARVRIFYLTLFFFVCLSGGLEFGFLPPHDKGLDQQPLYRQREDSIPCTWRSCQSLWTRRKSGFYYSPLIANPIAFDGDLNVKLKL